MHLNIGGILLTSMILLTSCSATSKRDKIDEWSLVWSDEFDHNGLPDQSKWAYDKGWGCDLPCGCGWGNGEKQTYTHLDERNARVVNGNLIIEAHKIENAPEDKPQFSSARLITKDRGHWKYGRIECRAKMPDARGTWSAFWMLPVDNAYGGWPNSGEIDIIEHMGATVDSVLGTVHTGAYNGMKKTHKGGHVIRPGLSEGFHTYKIDWSPKRITWYLDGDEYFTFSKEDGSDKWPFDQPFYMLLNLAIGGSLGGTHGIDAASFPQRLLIDYIRVYQKEEYEKI